MKWVKINEVRYNDKNPRVIRDDKFAKLKRSIIEFPEMLEKRPLVCVTRDDGKLMVLGGNMRLKALNDIGAAEVPVILADDWTEEQRARFLIADNVGFGEWDWDELANEWNADDLEKWGLDLPEMKVEAEAEEDNYEMPDEVQTDIVLGDLFEIGEHRLLCGDSTDSDQVEKLMNAEKAEMVFTDPPYKQETNGGPLGDIGKALRKQGKDIEFIADFNPSDFLNTLPIVFHNKKMNAYVFCNKELLPDYLTWAKQSGYSFNVLIWKKPNALPIADSHRPDIEYLLLFRKSAIWNNSLQNVNYSRCLEYGRETGLHPTMKPIELISNELQISSNKNSVVVDFFTGSGSTMVAAHQLKRKCYGMELDPKYCQVIIDRMLKLDPTLEVKRNGQTYTKTEQ